MSEITKSKRETWKCLLYSIAALGCFIVFDIYAWLNPGEIKTNAVVFFLAPVAILITFLLILMVFAFGINYYVYSLAKAGNFKKAKAVLTRWTFLNANVSILEKVHAAEIEVESRC